MRKGDGLLFGRALLAVIGIWLITSPWAFGYARHTHAVQDAVVGILLIAACAISTFAGPRTAVPLWAALALGVGTFVTPMMFGKSGSTFSANNDVFIGLLTVLAAATAIVSRARLRLGAMPSDPHAASEQTNLW